VLRPRAARDGAAALAFYDALLVLERLDDSFVALLAPRAPRSVGLCDFAFGHLNRGPDSETTPPSRHLQSSSEEVVVVDGVILPRGDDDDEGAAEDRLEDQQTNDTAAMLIGREYLRRHPLEAELYATAVARLDEAIDAMGRVAFDAAMAEYQPCLGDAGRRQRRR